MNTTVRELRGIVANGRFLVGSVGVATEQLRSAFRPFGLSFRARMTQLPHFS